MRDFDFEVFSDYLNHSNTYTLTFNKLGWYVQHLSVNGQCGPDGNPFLQMNFDHDYFLHLPKGIEEFLVYLWDEINNGNITDEQVIQDRLNDIANWISACEKNMPKWQGFNCYAHDK